MALDVRRIPDDKLDELVGTAELHGMKDVCIDDVLAYTDRGLDNLPTYRELYRRAVQQQWSPDELDFSRDRDEWVALSPATRSRRLWGLRLFFSGEERVASLLAPLVWAEPSKEVAAFVAAQLADEVRHTYFFERYWREVVGTSAHDLDTLVEQIKPVENAAYEHVFYAWLPALARRLASTPHDLDAAVEFVTLYHLVVEGALFLTGMRYQLEGARRWGRTWGFYEGFTAATRDESRHVLFGVRYLQDALARNAARFGPVIQATISKSLPMIEGHIAPRGADTSRFGGSHLEVAWPGYTPDRLQDEMLGYAKRILTRRLRAAGLHMAA